VREGKGNMIKKILMVIFGKFAKAHAKEIRKAQKWIDSAQAQFASAIEEAEIAEQEFNKIAQKKEEQINEILAELNDVTKKARQAEQFKNKIKQFIEE
jgi:transcriptional regulator of heat shock response